MTVKAIITISYIVVLLSFPPYSYCSVRTLARAMSKMKCTSNQSLLVGMARLHQTKRHFNTQSFRDFNTLRAHIENPSAVQDSKNKEQAPFNTKGLNSLSHDRLNQLFKISQARTKAVDILKRTGSKVRKNLKQLLAQQKNNSDDAMNSVVRHEQARVAHIQTCITKALNKFNGVTVELTDCNRQERPIRDMEFVRLSSDETRPSIILAALASTFKQRNYVNIAEFCNAKGDEFKLTKDKLVYYLDTQTRDQQEQLMKTAKDVSPITMTWDSTMRGYYSECITVKINSDETDSDKVYAVLKAALEENRGHQHAAFRNSKGDEFVLRRLSYRMQRGGKSDNYEYEEYRAKVDNKKNAQTANGSDATGTLIKDSETKPSIIMPELRKMLDLQATFWNKHGDKFELNKNKLIKLPCIDSDIRRQQEQLMAENIGAITIVWDSGKGDRYKCVSGTINNDETDSDRVYAALKKELEWLPLYETAEFTNSKGDEFTLGRLSYDVVNNKGKFDNYYYQEYRAALDNTKN